MKSKNIYILLIAALLVSSCKKGWLDVKPTQSLVVPTTVSNYQALLDNTVSVFNIKAPELGEMQSDDYYVNYASYQSFVTNVERGTYVWASDPYQGDQTNLDWDDAYNRVLSANIVLDGIKNVPTNVSNQSAWNNVEGSALFFRAFDFYNLTTTFCKYYNAATATSDLGIPLRLTSDINVKTSRSSLQASYDQIIADLKNAQNLLPISPLFPTRPSKAAVFGLLSRVYLSMGDYKNASIFADSCLALNNGLLDFNSGALSPGTLRPIPAFNTEVIFQSIMESYGSIFVTNAMVDTILYKSYSVNDLRLTTLFYNFKGAPRFLGSYASTPGFSDFNGIATDEMYLIKAECEARAGNTSSAMNELNALLVKRYKTGTFIPLTAANAEDALNQILVERRKELLFRGLRWTDLKRLNTEPNHQVTLTRVLNGQTYTLPPNDKRYVFPIPPDEVRLNGLQQN